MWDTIWNMIQTAWNAALVLPLVDIILPILALVALCAIHRVSSAKFRVVAILVLSILLFLSGVWTHTDYMRIQSAQTTQAPSADRPSSPTPSTK